jgi:hypothetical protein
MSAELMSRVMEHAADHDFYNDLLRMADNGDVEGLMRAGIPLDGIDPRDYGYWPVTRRKAERTSKQPIPQDIRWRVWERDNFTCQNCGARQRLSVDHIIPESKGGTLALDNLQTLCSRCNSSKGSR